MNNATIFVKRRVYGENGERRVWHGYVCSDCESVEDMEGYPLVDESVVSGVSAALMERLKPIFDKNRAGGLNGILANIVLMTIVREVIKLSDLSVHPSDAVEFLRAIADSVDLGVQEAQKKLRKDKK